MEEDNPKKLFEEDFIEINAGFVSLKQKLDKLEEMLEPLSVDRKIELKEKSLDIDSLSDYSEVKANLIGVSNTLFNLNNRLNKIIESLDL